MANDVHYISFGSMEKLKLVCATHSIYPFHIFLFPDKQNQRPSVSIGFTINDFPSMILNVFILNISFLDYKHIIFAC